MIFYTTILKIYSIRILNLQFTLPSQIQKVKKIFIIINVINVVPNYPIEFQINPTLLDLEYVFENKNNGLSVNPWDGYKPVVADWGQCRVDDVHRLAHLFQAH